MWDYDIHTLPKYVCHTTIHMWTCLVHSQKIGLPKRSLSRLRAKTQSLKILPSRMALLRRGLKNKKKKMFGTTVPVGVSRN